jgi:hypothetical protein
MIYVIDNGEIRDDHRIYFVEAPESFRTWFETVLLPWQRAFIFHEKKAPRGRAWFKRHSLICIAKDVAWMTNGYLISAEFYLAVNMFVPRGTIYDEDLTTLVPYAP